MLHGFVSFFMPLGLDFFLSLLSFLLFLIFWDVIPLLLLIHDSLDRFQIVIILFHKGLEMKREESCI